MKRKSAREKNSQEQMFGPTKFVLLKQQPGKDVTIAMSSAFGL